jgi:hypothetical protein
MCALIIVHTVVTLLSLLAVDCCMSAQELPAVHASDHQAAHLLQNAITSWAYGSPRSLTITLQHFTRVYDAVHGSSAAAAAAAGCGSDLSTLTGVMHVSDSWPLTSDVSQRRSM